MKDLTKKNGAVKKNIVGRSVLDAVVDLQGSKGVSFQGLKKFLRDANNIDGPQHIKLMKLTIKNGIDGGVLSGEGGLYKVKGAVGHRGSERFRRDENQRSSSSHINNRSHSETTISSQSKTSNVKVPRASMLPKTVVPEQQMFRKGLEELSKTVHKENNLTLSKNSTILTEIIHKLAVHLTSVSVGAIIRNKPEESLRNLRNTVQSVYGPELFEHAEGHADQNLRWYHENVLEFSLKPFKRSTVQDSEANEILTSTVIRKFAKSHFAEVSLAKNTAEKIGKFLNGILHRITQETSQLVSSTSVTETTIGSKTIYDGIKNSLPHSLFRLAAAHADRRTFQYATGTLGYKHKTPIAKMEREARVITHEPKVINYRKGIKRMMEHFHCAPGRGFSLFLNSILNSVCHAIAEKCPENAQNRTNNLTLTERDVYHSIKSILPTNLRNHALARVFQLQKCSALSIKNVSTDRLLRSTLRPVASESSDRSSSESLEQRSTIEDIFHDQSFLPRHGTASADDIAKSSDDEDSDSNGIDPAAFLSDPLLIEEASKEQIKREETGTPKMEQDYPFLEKNGFQDEAHLQVEPQRSSEMSDSKSQEHEAKSSQVRVEESEGLEENGSFKTHETMSQELKEKRSDLHEDKTREMEAKQFKAQDEKSQENIGPVHIDNEIIKLRTKSCSELHKDSHEKQEKLECFKIRKVKSLEDIQTFTWREAVEEGLDSKDSKTEVSKGQELSLNSNPFLDLLEDKKVTEKMSQELEIKQKPEISEEKSLELETKRSSDFRKQSEQEQEERSQKLYGEEDVVETEVEGEELETKTSFGLDKEKSRQLDKKESPESHEKSRELEASEDSEQHEVKHSRHPDERSHELHGKDDPVRVEDKSIKPDAKTSPEHSSQELEAKHSKLHEDKNKLETDKSSETRKRLSQDIEENRSSNFLKDIKTEFETQRSEHDEKKQELNENSGPDHIEDKSVKLESKSSSELEKEKHKQEKLESPIIHEIKSLEDRRSFNFRQDMDQQLDAKHSNADETNTQKLIEPNPFLALFEDNSDNENTNHELEAEGRLEISDGKSEGLETRRNSDLPEHSNQELETKRSDEHKEEKQELKEKSAPDHIADKRINLESKSSSELHKENRKQENLESPRIHEVKSSEDRQSFNSRHDMEQQLDAKHSNADETNTQKFIEPNPFLALFADNSDEEKTNHELDTEVRSKISDGKSEELETRRNSDFREHSNQELEAKHSKLHESQSQRLNGKDGAVEIEGGGEEEELEIKESFGLDKEKNRQLDKRRSPEIHEKSRELEASADSEQEREAKVSKHPDERRQEEEKDDPGLFEYERAKREKKTSPEVCENINKLETGRSSEMRESQSRELKDYSSSEFHNPFSSYLKDKTSNEKTNHELETEGRAEISDSKSEELETRRNSDFHADSNQEMEEKSSNRQLEKKESPEINEKSREREASADSSGATRGSGGINSGPRTSVRGPEQGQEERHSEQPNRKSQEHDEKGGPVQNEDESESH